MLSILVTKHPLLGNMTKAVIPIRGSAKEHHNCWNPSTILHSSSKCLTESISPWLQRSTEMWWQEALQCPSQRQEALARPQGHPQPHRPGESWHQESVRKLSGSPLRLGTLPRATELAVGLREKYLWTTQNLLLFRRSNESGERDWSQWCGETSVRKQREKGRKPVNPVQAGVGMSVWPCLYLTSTVCPGFSLNSLFSDFPRCGVRWVVCLFV